MNIPSNLKYTRDHEWLKLEEDGTALVGITDYAQNALGDIVFVELPRLGAAQAGQQVSTIESVKAVSDVLCPVNGEITAVNTTLETTPELLNTDPYGVWLFKLAQAEVGSLLSDTEYAKFLLEEV